MAWAARSISLSSPNSRMLSRSIRVRAPMRWNSCSADSLLSVGVVDMSPTLCPFLRQLLEDLGNLLIERCCRERLDHIAVRAGLCRGDDVFLLGLGRHHQYRQL